MTLRSIPLGIIGRRPLSLTVYDGDGERFAGLFLEVWRQLPLSVREKILGHWSNDENPDLLLELSNGWKNCTTRDGETSLCGCSVKFSAAKMDLVFDVSAKFLIAHELAHVYQYATRTNRRPYEDLESEADELADHWGFPRRPCGSEE